MNSKQDGDFDQTCTHPSAPATPVSDVSPALMVGGSSVGSVRRERKGTARSALISTIAQGLHVIQVSTMPYFCYHSLRAFKSAAPKLFRALNYFTFSSCAV